MKSEKEINNMILDLITTKNIRGIFVYTAPDEIDIVIRTLRWVLEEK